MASKIDLRKEFEMKINNLCAKHMNKFNKSQTHVDKKKQSKDGYSKHKKDFSHD